MPNVVLYEDANHRNVMLEDFGFTGMAVQANQHLIIDGAEGMILDPGGHQMYARALSETMKLLGSNKLRHIFLSHQDPDIVAAINGWLMTTDAEAHVSSLWTRFVAHFGVDHLVEHRLKPIPDEGMHLELGQSKIILIPAHFMHSAGNFQVYDPTSKILYTGDLGASLGAEYNIVPDFESHIRYMKDFHQRYMTSNAILRAWADMVRELDIESIAPQHGALFVGSEMVNQFIDWCAELTCGVDLAKNALKVPEA